MTPTISKCETCAHNRSNGGMKLECAFALLKAYRGNNLAPDLDYTCKAYYKVRMAAGGKGKRKIEL